MLEVSRPHSYSPFKACPRFTPAHLLTPAEFFMRLQIWKAARREKQKMGKLQKESRDTSHKTTPPEGGVLLLLLIPV
ncbi:hypothetical protein FPF18_12275 [Escherichia coli]|uniref:Uncharacterized protein n=1 Tax=Escherichia coli TaxID=562 RepID=A0A826J519_ECOLX|nr:hypothetical protein [Escherichia coli]EFA4844811.1 hypothetical protein [Escherichia coli]EFB1608621.1 hypothetical protein [Escherichia coli]EFB5293736.1 hypothetical protein [Escherichia coli]EFB6922330.1 hypothetical protein [Escherichia coli]